MPKVLIIGFDGATWNIIMPLINQNKLPTFKTLLDNSAWGYMESTIPPLSVPAWVSMFSGLTPAQLGIFDFTDVTILDNSYKIRLFSSQDTRNILLWDFLSKEGLTSFVINIPNTYPPYPVNGHLIGLDFTPLKKCTYPPEIEHTLEKEFNLKKIRESQPMLFKREKAALQVIKMEEKTIANIVLSFTAHHSYDLVVVRFGIPDHVSHHSHDQETMTKYHFLMDSLLKTIIDSVEYDYLFLVSDHGIKKEDTLIYINPLLEELGYYHYSPKERVIAHGMQVFKSLFGKRQLIRVKRKLTGRDIRKGTLEYEMILGKTIVFGYATTITSFCPLFTKDYAVIDEVIEKVGASPYVKKIHRVQKKQKKTNKGPFAIVESVCALSGEYSRKKISTNKAWLHDKKGIFLVHGKDIKKGRIDCTIFDITPTILHILGLPIPDNITGRILTDVFTEQSPITSQPPQYVKPEYYRKKEEKQKIKDSLKKLKI
jgi:predicted AlkP superfamily phosphohydrolase/phosphomutase